MACGTCFARYILCIFNFLIFIAGGAIMGVGIWVLVDKNSFLDFTSAVDDSASFPQLQEFTQPEMLSQIGYMLLAAGGFIFILSLLGYCGAIRQSRCLLGFYGFLLVAILILEATAAGLAYVYRERAEMETKKLLKDTIQDYYTPETDKFNSATNMWNYIMKKMSCCGVDNYTDFGVSEKFKQSNQKVPLTCCKMNETAGVLHPLDPDCPKNPKPENSYYLTGCYKTLTDLILGHMNVIIYVVVVLVLVELLTTFLAFCLCKSIEPYDKLSHNFSFSTKEVPEDTDSSLF